jgi:hypothetical protein
MTEKRSMLRELGRFVEQAGNQARRNPPAIVATLSAAMMILSPRFPIGSMPSGVLFALTFIGGCGAGIFGYLQGLDGVRRARRDHSFASDELPTQESSLPPPPPLEDEHNLETSEKTRRYYLKQIRYMTDEMVEHLRWQITALGRRANINLSVGVLICLTGFCVLGYVVFNEIPSMWTFMSRMAFVVFVEVFAYFFLNLYRSGLQDIKYFSNEITNSTFRVMALEAAMSATGPNSQHAEAAGSKIDGDKRKPPKVGEVIIDEICRELARTERNFVLKRNETTHDLRQVELLMRQDKSFSATLEKTLVTINKALDKTAPASARQSSTVDTVSTQA